MDEEPLRDWLHGQVAESETFLGAQVAIADGDTVESVSVGCDVLGDRIDDHSLVAARCAVTKPLVALACCRLCATGTLDMAATLGSILDGLHPDTATVTVAQVLTHSGGLHSWGSIAMQMLRPEVRLALARATSPVRPWAVGEVAEYDDAMGWLLLGEVLEQVTGRPYDDVVAESVLDPLGLGDELVLRCEAGGIRSRVRVNGEQIDSRLVPRLFEVTDLSLSEWNSSWGGLATAAGLARFYAAAVRPSSLPPDLAAAFDLLSADGGAEGPKRFGHGVELDVFRRVTRRSGGPWGFGMASDPTMGFALADAGLGVAVQMLGHPADLDRYHVVLCSLLDRVLEAAGIDATA